MTASSGTPNNLLQRIALRAAAEPERWADGETKCYDVAFAHALGFYGPGCSCSSRSAAPCRLAVL